MARSRTSRSLLPALAIAACARGVTPPSPPAPFAPPEAVETSIFLVGDAGEPDPSGEPVLAALRAAVTAASGERLVVFLGDNVYPAGLPDSAAPNRAEAERRLEAQLAAVADLAAVVLVPGNHDWAGNHPDGWEAVRRQERYARARGGRLLPAGGCPGPDVIDVGERLRLVLLDTHWWLRTGPKPAAGTGGCLPDTPGAVTDSLRGALRAAGARHVAVLGHHPLATGGPHGGHFTWRDHIFPLTAAVPWLWIPLPILGSLYPLARQAGWSDQDLSGSRNVAMRDSLSAAFGERRPLVYAAGHEHNLQILDGDAARHLIVSGAGRYYSISHVRALADTRYALAAGGFVRLDVLTDGRIRLSVIVAERDGGGQERFSMWLDTEPGD